MLRDAWRCAGVIGLAILVWADVARAQDPVTEVEVAPDAVELDADKVRAQVGSELHTHTVAPGDPAAAGAKGTLRIAIDRETKTLSVTYLARATPVTREVPLPADAASARSAAAMLAGNLARDEAGELAAELRAQHQPAAPPAPTTAQLAERAALAERKQAAMEGARMDAILDYYARADRRSRMVWGWSLIVMGAVGSVAVLYADRPLSVDGSLHALPNPVLAFGIVTLVVKTPLEELAASGATEADWIEAAIRERRTRDFGGVALLSFCGLALGAATLVLADRDLSIDSDTRLEASALLLAGGVLLGGAGIHDLTSDGPVESGLKTFELGSGRPVALRLASGGVPLRLAFVPGGAMATFGASF